MPKKAKGWTPERRAKFKKTVAERRRRKKHEPGTMVLASGAKRALPPGVTVHEGGGKYTTYARVDRVPPGGRVDDLGYVYDKTGKFIGVKSIEVKSDFTPVIVRDKDAMAPTVSGQRFSNLRRNACNAMQLAVSRISKLVGQMEDDPETMALKFIASELDKATEQLLKI